MTKNSKDQQEQYMIRRIGSTTYKVKVVFSEDTQETMEDKMIHLIRNSVDTDGNICAIMDSSQMSRQSERSAS